MTLSRHLAPIALSTPCPHCGFVLTMKGSWFTTVSHYKCARCKRDIRWTYSSKVRLFAEYTAPLVVSTCSEPQQYEA